MISARGLRSLGQGFLSVLLAIFLARKGLGLPEIGFFLSAGVVGGGLYALALGLLVARVGRRGALVGLTLMAAVWSAGLVVTDSPWLLALCALLGSLAGVGGVGGTGPAQPVEQAILADVCPPNARTMMFARYRFVSSMAAAAGALAAGLPDWLEYVRAVPVQLSMNAMILAFSFLLMASALLYALLPREVEMRSAAPAFVNPVRTPSRRLILGLNSLFAVDQLGSSIVPASLMAYWFYTRFGLALDDLGLLAFVTQLLSALSMWVSAGLSKRIGYVRTMVFTHIPASLMLVALPAAPGIQWAVALWLGRGLLSQMDIPARDALTMAVVGKDERVAMGSLHLLGRNGMGAIGPVLSTSLWQAFTAAAPLVLGGLLKVGYDISLYVLYRDVRLRGE